MFQSLEMGKVMKEACKEKVLKLTKIFEDLKIVEMPFHIPGNFFFQFYREDNKKRSQIQA